MQTDCKTGLTATEVSDRLSRGLVNLDSTPKTKSAAKILFENVCTLFNLINFILAAAVALVGSYKNMLFMGVVLCNLFIGIVQEIRAKRSVDKLSLSAPSRVTVIRDANQSELSHEQLVLDDIVVLKTGEQITADCELVHGGCTVNEAFITGEADAVFKDVGSKLYAGSFVTSGMALAQVTSVGDDNYIASISSRVKYVKKVNSEIMTALTKIIKTVSFVIFPMGALLFYNQFANSGEPLAQAVVNTVAALTGMIPEGLVLLTSTVLAAAVIRLSRSRVLVQSLYCIETLARVDVLCLDKTGTITQGVMECYGTMSLTDGSAEEDLRTFVTLLEDDNPVFGALCEKYKGGGSCHGLKATASSPFDSTKKWSGVTVNGEYSIVLGAAEFIIKPDEKLRKLLEEYSEDYRVLVLAKSEKPIVNGALPDGLTPAALVLLRDRIRDGARETMNYFTAQGVELKVISGDGAKTVSEIAKRADVPNSGKYIDVTGLPDEQLSQLAEEFTVFGRVTPGQKDILVKALQKNGHTVAMTGDGVNDVMALKQADCSVAMASGTAAARNISEIVLVDSDFSALPKVVRQGRQSINNIQRSASLFLIKTIYSSLLALIFMFVSMPYPFVPIQLTLISAFTIGIPSFVLGLEPNDERIKGGFLKNILGRAAPGGLAVVLGIVTVMAVGTAIGITGAQLDTVYVSAAAAAGLANLFFVCVPFNRIRITLFVLMCSAIALAMLFFNSFFGVCALGFKAALLLTAVVAEVILFILLLRHINRMVDKNLT